MRKFFDVVLKMLKNNLLLKIAAIIFAVILWSFVIADTNPPRTKYVENVPVKFENMQALKDKKLTVSEDLSRIIQTVKLRLEVKQKELSFVNVDNVSASVDFSKINAKGETEVKITGKTQYGTVTAIEPASIKFTVDDYVKKSVPVECSILSSENASYYIGEPEVTPGEIEIAGARKDVEKVSGALCKIDATALTSGVNKSMDVVLLDENSIPVDERMFFEFLPSVIVKIEVLPKKTVNINGPGSIVNADKLKYGYEIKSVSTLPDKIEVAAENGLLVQINEIFLENMDVEGAYKTAAFRVKPKTVEGLRFLYARDIEVTVEIGQIEESRKFSGIKVNYINKPLGAKIAMSPKTLDVTITGGVLDVNKIKRDDINIYVDLKGLSKGGYELPAVISELENISNITLSTSNIKVTIK